VILQHPIIEGLAQTYEDPSVTTPEGRMRAFGQDDHVRFYGGDFPDRLAAAGFDVQRVRYPETLDPSRRARYRLDERAVPGGGRGDDLYIAAKPA
jgi:hypothetical protein